jgi:hypothetical protein
MLQLAIEGMPVNWRADEPVYSNRLGFATSATAILPARGSCDALIHHGSQSYFRISQMLRQKRCALFRLSTGQQLVDSTMCGNEATWIIVLEIDENHPHPQFT